MACIDLSSDHESPVRPAHKRQVPVTPASAIQLLSSEDERHNNSEGSAERPLPDAVSLGRLEHQASFMPSTSRDNPANDMFPEDMPFAEPINRVSPQALAGKKRPRKAAKKAMDFDFDVNELMGMDGDTNADMDFGTGTQAALSSPETLNTQRSQPKKRRGKLTEEEKAARAAARLEAREAKKREKEAEKLQKQAQRAQDKLNRKRETGKTALVDCTIHLDPELAKHRLGRDIMQKLEDTYGVPGVEGPAVEISQRLPLWPHRCATWSRKTYHASGDGPSSESQAQQQQSIPYHMLFLAAEEFVNHVLKDGLQSIIQHAAQKCPDSTLGLLVEGLEHYLVQTQRKAFQVNGPGGGGFNRACIDEFLGNLPCKYPGIRHVIVPDSASAAEHVAGMTRAIAEQPFRAEEAYVKSFGAGKPDSQAMGELLRKAPLPHSDREVWFKALSAIPRLGPQSAHAICGSFASMGALLQAYTRSPADKDSLLQGLACFGGKRIGPAGSKLVAQVLTSDDPNLCI